MRKEVPVVLRTDRNAGSFRSVSRASLGHRVADLPQVGGDFLFPPLALVVVPLVTSADLHARISLSLMLFEVVVRDRRIALRLVLRFSRRAGLWCHGRSCCPGALQTGDRHVVDSITVLGDTLLSALSRSQI